MGMNVTVTEWKNVFDNDTVTDLPETAASKLVRNICTCSMK